MRSIFLSCAIALIATSASAGGIYTNRTTAQTATGLANVATTLWSTNIPGTGVSPEDAMLIHVSTAVSSTQTGTIKIKLNGVQLGPTIDVFDVPVDIDMRVTRLASGSSQAAAWVTGTVTYKDPSLNLGVFPLIGGTYTASGLAWGSQQALTVVGQSNETNGIFLSYAGVQR